MHARSISLLPMLLRAQGKTKKTLQVLHKIADLDPDNTQVRLKLAEGYLKEGMRPEAAKTFCEAAGRMLENGDFEKSLDAYSKALELRPQDKVILRGTGLGSRGIGNCRRRRGASRKGR